MRPAVSDYGLFGAGRAGALAPPGRLRRHRHVQLAHPRRRTRRGRSGRRSRPRPTLPSGTQIAYDTRSGATPQPDGSWSAWQPVGAGGAIASPAARYIQYRARMTSSTGVVSPTLKRVQIIFGAGTDRAPVPGHGHGRAGRAEDQPDAHRDAERVQRPRRRPADLPLPVAAQRHAHRGRDLRLARPVAAGQRRSRRRRCASRSTRPTARAPPATRPSRP